MGRGGAIVWAVWASACGNVTGGRPDAAPVDAVVTVDARAADAPPIPREDAAPPDATVPASPPFSNGQAADLVIGQVDFTSSTASIGAGRLATPTGLATDGTHLWIGDNDNNRVLQWNSPPIVDGALANVVIGQPGPTTRMDGPTQAILGRAGTSTTIHVFSDGARVLVSDAANHRVMIWESPPTSDGAPANLVLGQTSFTTFASGAAAHQLALPQGIWSDGTRLVVADFDNHRVLIWRTFPTANGAPADVVLGQPAFGTREAPDPPSASSMHHPTDVFYDGARLFVSDSFNSRILVWHGFPDENGLPADVVIGQSGFASGLPNAGGTINAAGLYKPQALLVARGSLIVADTQNHRVVAFTPVPTTSGPSASVVLGRDDLSTGGVPVAAADTLGRPRGLIVIDDQLWVGQAGFHRATRFALVSP